MKSSWKIISSLDSKEIGDPFEGNYDQAKAYLNLVYDPQFCHLMPSNRFEFELDDLRFEGTDSMLECRRGDDLLFSVDNELMHYDADGIETNTIKADGLMLFPGFKQKATCQTCYGEKRYTAIECNSLASECCGGCEVIKECDCEEIEFKIEA